MGTPSSKKKEASSKSKSGPSFSKGLGFIRKNQTALELDDLSTAPFNFVVLACAYSAQDLSSIRKHAGLKGALPIYGHVPSQHLIGIKDDFKSYGEMVAEMFDDRRIVHLTGGHVVGREERKNTKLISDLRHFMKTCESGN